MKKLFYVALFIFICACNTKNPQTQTETAKEGKPDPCAIFSQEIITLAKADPYFFYIVDKNNLLDETYTPNDLIGKGKFAIRKKVAQAFKELQDAAKKEGLNIWLLSGFRSYKRQEALYQGSLKRRGFEHTNLYVARPGSSQHQLGMAVDVNNVHTEFTKTKEYTWLKENAAKFGFSLSFPEGQEDKTGYAFEPWHYRYITPEGSRLQKEYFNDSQVDFLEALNACLK